MGAPEPVAPTTGATGSSSYGESRDDADHESEWEYEYDEDEREEFYFTLDVTSNQSELASKAYRSKRSYNRSEAKPVHNGEVPNAVGNEPLSAQATPTPTPNGNAQHETLPAKEDSIREKVGPLQMLDLHTSNPLVKCGRKLYSCHWSTDLGTQFYLTAPGVVDQALRSGRILDVVSLSRTRLVGTPATLRRREDTAADVQPENAIEVESDGEVVEEDDDVDITADTPDDVLLRTIQPGSSRTPLFAAARRQTKDPTLKAQASFLERLTAIKEKKGETDRVPINGVKNYTTPVNKDEIRFAEAERHRMEFTRRGTPRQRALIKRRPKSMLNGKKAPSASGTVTGASLPELVAQNQRSTEVVQPEPVVGEPMEVDQQGQPEAQAPG